MLSKLMGEERPITTDEACAIRLLLFGNTVRSFTQAWTQQGFKFKNHPPYRLTQKNAGPCGVVAAVQAFVLYELLFGYSRVLLEDGFLRPKIGERNEALARALANILWQAGDRKNAVVASVCDNVVLDDDVTSSIIEGDGILEYVKLKFFRSFEDLLAYLYNFRQNFTRDGGTILFMYSLLLTHGIDKIKEEMDCPESPLIGGDGYCSLEVINLILIGKAVPNLFNGDIEMKFDSEETSILRGIPNKSNIGFLSAYEYQETCNVGSHYKEPKYPIWVLFGQSHFTVLFGTSRDIFTKTDEVFKLFHTDSLFTDSTEVCLTINPSANQEAPVKDMTLPVHIRCILTRWPLAEIQTDVLKKAEKEPKNC